ncbi:MAG: DNA-packaging protein, partial [Prevotella sp.]|nr:DNA-packaging protein [Prevotella sp.]
MATEQNNRLWKISGKRKQTVFESPENLLRAAYEYFEWCDKHTWFKREILKSGDRKGSLARIPVVRPYSLGGLCIHLGCSLNFFNKFKQTSNPDFAEAIACIENIIETQHFEGLTLGLFNAAGAAKRASGQERQAKTSGSEHPFKVEVIDGAAQKAL